MAKYSKSEQVLDLARKVGVLRPRDLAQRGIPAVYLHRLHRRGMLVQSARGLYTLSKRDLTANHSLAQVCKRIPHGVVCLLSALRFHGLTTQMPAEVWIAIDRKARRPAVGDLPVRIVRFSGAALREGVEEHRIEGITVRVTNPAKTIADCFKYRNKIGLDVALEALREGWRERGFSMDELWKYARLCRVANVMRPYLEAMV